MEWIADQGNGLNWLYSPAKWDLLQLVVDEGNLVQYSCSIPTCVDKQ